jgi:hypothetical protein
MLENPASNWRAQVSLATLSNLYLCLKCLPTTTPVDCIAVQFVPMQHASIKPGPRGTNRIHKSNCKGHKCLLVLLFFFFFFLLSLRSFQTPSYYDNAGRATISVYLVPIFQKSLRTS